MNPVRNEVNQTPLKSTLPLPLREGGGGGVIPPGSCGFTPPPTPSLKGRGRVSFNGVWYYVVR